MRCNVPIPTIEQIKHAPPAYHFQQIVDSLPVLCVFQCGNVCPRSSFPDHLKVCSLAKLTCSYADNNNPAITCNVTVARADFEAHQQSCEYRQIRCQHANCNFSTNASKMTNHESQCVFRGTTCPNADCSVVVVFKDLHDHLDVCPYQPVGCGICFKDQICQEIVNRQDMAVHRSSCGLRTILCANVRLLITVINAQIIEYALYLNCTSSYCI